MPDPTPEELAATALHAVDLGAIEDAIRTLPESRASIAALHRLDELAVALTQLKADNPEPGA